MSFQIVILIIHFPAVDDNVLYGDLYVPYLYYALVSAIPVAFGAILVAYVEVNQCHLLKSFSLNGFFYLK